MYTVWSERGGDMRTLSVCSGAGGMDLGFHRAGFDNAALCEWDEWRRRLLAARFPGVPVHHDLAELADWCERDPDAVREWCGGQPRLLIGGTPCQDLSVAGRRAGLDGERSGLYYAYQRVRLALGIEWAVWENVAGALSSNDGLDFAQVLAAFVGADVPVPAAGWAGAGVAAGPWGGCVWRILDAQHFGVPQRRRRVFVVGRLGGPCPPEVLLEPARSGRDSQASRGSRARVAAPLTRGSSGAGVSEPGRRQEDDINIVSTLQARGSTGGFDVDPAMAAGGHLIAGPLTCRYAKGINTTCDDGAMVVPPLVSGSSRGKPTPLSPGHAGADGHIVAHTLRAEGFDASEDGTGRGTPLTVVGRDDLLPDGRDAERLLSGGRTQPDAEDRQRDRGPDAAGDAAGVHGASSDADGVRAADGLAGRLDVAAVGALRGTDGRRNMNGDVDGANAGHLIADTGLAARESCAVDPQPDGRRYAACGDGVVAAVAEWIGCRLAEVATQEGRPSGMTGLDPCANCGHLRNQHRHVVLPWFSQAPRDRECKADGCPCELYVDEPTEEEAERAA